MWWHLHRTGRPAPTESAADVDGMSAIRWSLAALMLALVLALVSWAISTLVDAAQGAREQQCDDLAKVALAVPVGAEGRDFQRERAAGSHPSFFATGRVSDAVRRARNVSDKHA